MSQTLIIFDCDGTLVDSEMLYNTITSELLQACGLDEYTPERCVELFAGQSWWMIKEYLQKTHGIDIPNQMVQDFVDISLARIGDIEPAKDALAVIEELSKRHQLCVASNGERGGVLKSLAVTKLDQYFPGHNVFTKIQVKRPKPAPDLFLFTAMQMGFEPEQCIVIEDSVAGVSAAVAANIKVIGYTGCTHDKQKQRKMLEEAGANIIIDELIHISDHI